MKKTLLTIVALAFLLITIGSSAQTPINSDWWVPNRVVNTIVSDDNYTYIGGEFTNIGPNTGQGVTIDPSTGIAATDMPLVNGSVNIAVPDGNGGWYIGGSFTSVEGVDRNHLAHIKPDKTVNLEWNPNMSIGEYPDIHEVRVIAISGNNIYVGGQFTSIGGKARTNIAKLNNTTGDADETWNPGANNKIWTIAISGDDIYVGGEFTEIGGQSRNRIAKLNNTTGDADETWNPGANNKILTIAISGDDIYVGGEFTKIGGQSRNRIAKLNNTTGDANETWNSGANNRVWTIAISGDDIYVGGEFTYIGVQSRNRIAKLNNTNGDADETWNPSANSVVWSIALAGENIYAGGNFTSIGGEPRNYIAKLNNTDGIADPNWNPNANQSVRIIAISGDDIYLGGNFSSIGGQTRNRIARFHNSDGTLDEAWNPNANSYVYTIALSGDDIYVGGSFTSIGGQTQKCLAKLNNTNGAANVAWNPNSNSVVRAITISGDDIYVGGQFTIIGGQTRNYIAKLNNTDGTADLNWNPNANTIVWSIAISGDDIYVGGQFTIIGGQTRNYIAKLNNTDGAADATWNPNASGTVNTIAIYGDDIYVGGGFTSIGGQTRNRIAKLNNTDGAADATWNPNASGTVNTIAIYGDDIYVGGGFTSIGGQTRNRIAKLNNTNGNPDASWDPNINSIVRLIYISNDNIFAGGEFTSVGGKAQQNFAVFDLSYFFISGTLSPFTTIAGTVSDAQTFTLSGSNLIADATVTAPIHFEVSTDGTTYSQSITVAQTDGVITDQIIYVRIAASASGGDHSGNITVASTDTPIQNIAVSGTVTPTYQINFDANNGEGGEVQTVVHGDLPTPPAVTRDGYNFLSWSPDIVEATEDATYTAQWEIIEYTVTYNLEGGDNHEDNPAEFTIEDLTIALEDANKTTYTFLGWFDNAELAGEAVTQISTIGDKELWASFEAIEYTITYNADGVTHANPTTFTVEDLNITLADATKDGYTFLGWFDNAELTGEAVTQITEIGDVELWANFEVANYTITYHADGGTHANPATFTLEDLDITLADATKDGYTFLGWFDNAELAGEAVTQISTIGNVELWASFKIIEYTITASSGDNGGISPEGNVVVEHGNSQSFVFTPDEGYVIETLSVDGNQINLENDENWDAETLTYEFVSVTSNHTVHVEFDIASAITFTQVVKPRAYPNPFSNHISISNVEGNERVVITNLAGQRIVDMFLNGNTSISTSTLKSGVYIISITNSKGDTFVSRIVKN